MKDSTNPTVMLVIEDEAIAFAENGEVICTEWNDGSPDWSQGTIADWRGEGGWDGYQRLLEALYAAEKNAELVLHRYPTRVPLEALLEVRSSQLNDHELAPPPRSGR